MTHTTKGFHEKKDERYLREKELYDESPSADCNTDTNAAHQTSYWVAEKKRGHCFTDCGLRNIGQIGTKFEKYWSDRHQIWHKSTLTS